MSDESPKDARGPRRAAQVAARGALWAPSRFFDPRFQGLHQHLDLAYHDLLAHFDDVVAHVDTGRDEAKAHREAVVYELKVLRDLLERQIRAASEATTIIGRTVDEQRGAVESLLDRLEAEAAAGSQPAVAAYVEKALAAVPEGGSVVLAMPFAGDREALDALLEGFEVEDVTLDAGLALVTARRPAA
jgi:hypothetical protein